jgi:predicted O-methyltransferase YrrM
MLKEKLIKEFGEERLHLQFSAIQDEQDMREALAYLISLYPANVKKVAIETGTFHGVSTALLAEYFDEVHTFDICKEGGGYYKDENIKFEIWDFMKVSDKITFHMIKNDKEKEEIIKKIPYNFAFIDGQHKGGVDKDFVLLSRCGKVLFHDYCPEKCTPARTGMYDYVVEFIDTLAENIVYKKPPFVVWVKNNN